MKATEQTRLLPLLVPALSEAKGWHRHRGLGARGREREQVSPPIQEVFPEEELMSLNFGQIFEGSSEAS